MGESQGREQVLILVKALPQPGDRTGESAFSAGLTAQRAWRRQAPLPVSERPLRFSRWQWIAYDWRGEDSAGADRRVLPGTVEPGLVMPEAERASFLEPLVVGSLDEAVERGDGLALVRPGDPLFAWRKKRAQRLETERHAYALAAGRLAFLSGTPLEPSTYEFRLKYDLDDGRREDACADLELAARFAALAKRHGERRALDIMDETVNLEYAEAGMACVLAKDARRAGRWLLVAILRLDEAAQMTLL